MDTISFSIEIRAPVEKAFGYVADWRNAPNYVAHLESLCPTGSIRYGLGARLRGETRVLGLRLVSESEVVEFVHPRRIVARSVSGFTNTGTWIFESRPNGTYVTAVVEYNLQEIPLGRLMAPLVRGYLREGVKRSLENLKCLLEKGG